MTIETRLDAGWQVWFEQARKSFDLAFHQHLDQLPCAGPAARLIEAVAYSCRAGGKRARPVLVLEAARVCGGRAEEALPAALAVECIHTFSLIHDDLPAMDDDDLRRGQPTNHVVYGQALAILAGDWLVPHAFALLATNPVPPARVPGLVSALAEGTKDMVIGQAADIAGETRKTDKDLVAFIHRHKTAALLEACCVLGARSAGATDEQVAALRKFGGHLGLAFQIADDVLDMTASTEALGKTAGKDAAVDKQTWPAAFGIEASTARARQEYQAGIAALASFGPEADHLRGMAEFVIRRTN